VTGIVSPLGARAFATGSSAEREQRPGKRARLVFSSSPGSFCWLAIAAGKLYADGHDLETGRSPVSPRSTHLMLEMKSENRRAVLDRGRDPIGITTQQESGQPSVAGLGLDDVAI
jgi:hypothetical protein